MSGGVGAVSVVSRFGLTSGIALLLSVAFGGFAESGFAASMLGPVDMRSSAGYTYRSLSEDGGFDDTSHQLIANFNASSYLWEPWLATSNLALSFAHDSTETADANYTATSDSQIITGDFDLNVLPQSKTPFNLQLQISDSRVDRSGGGLVPITFVGQDYSSSHLGLQQSYILENGGRYRAYMNLRSWEGQRGGDYDDTLLGVEADLRWPRQHLLARATSQVNEYTMSSSDNESTLLDLNHYYYPLRHLRVDTRASMYDYSRSFLDPDSSSTRMADYHVYQTSSFAFWRPANSPLTVSGGARIMVMDGAQGSVYSNDQLQMSANAGAFYQFNKRVRLDGGFTTTLRDTAGLKENYLRFNAGGSYQSDWRLLAGFMHQYYANASSAYVVEPDSVEDLDSDDDAYLEWGGGAGHGLNKTWWLGERTSPTSIRMNINQAFRYFDSGASYNIDGSQQRLEHSVTTAYNQRIWSGNWLAQATLSDSRNLGSATDERQMFHLQISRDQDIGRRSSVVGDVTTQYVRSKSGGFETDTTTTTVGVEYNHTRIFGVPRLMFISDLMVSKLSTDGAINRQDWDNRLTYHIGKLDTSFSYRLTETDSRNYDLLYFRVMRRF